MMMMMNKTMVVVLNKMVVVGKMVVVIISLSRARAFPGGRPPGHTQGRGEAWRSKKKEKEKNREAKKFFKGVKF